MASEISIEKCLRELKEALLSQDTTVQYTDIDIRFENFDVPKTVVYLDKRKVLHITMDDIFSEYSSHKLEPIIKHAVAWNEGDEDYMYPRNIGRIMFTRPEFMERFRRKFDARYLVPTEATVFSPELVSCLEDTMIYLSKIKPRMYKFSQDVQISWRKFPRNLEKSPIADVDAFCNRIFLDPALASAPLKTRAYIILHELAVVKAYNPQSLSPDRDRMEAVLHNYTRREGIVKYIVESGWWFKYGGTF